MSELEKTMASKWPMVTVGRVVQQDLRQASVHRSDLPYIGLDSIESQTGRLLAVENGSAVVGTSFYFDQRHVLYGKLRPYLNKVFVPGQSGLCSTELVPLLPDPVHIDRTYLGWFLRAPATVAILTGSSSGSRMPRANMRTVLGLSIPLPPLAEQRRIVDILHKAVAQIQRAADAIAEERRETTALRAAILRDALDPATHPSWPMVTLGRVVRQDLRQASVPRSDLPYIGLDSIESQTGRLLTVENGSTVVGTSFYFDQRHVLYGKLRPYLNKVFVPEQSGLCSTELVPLLPDPGCINRTYLSWFLRAPATVAALIGSSSGSRMPRASMRTVLGLSIPLPPIEEQHEIASRLDRAMEQVDRIIGTLDEEERQFMALRSSILDAAFRGEL